jgi:hypothetical protein
VNASEKTWNVLGLVALICLAAIAGADLIIPKPTNPLSQHQKIQDLEKLRKESNLQNDQLKTAKSEVSRYIWSENMDTITSKSLGAVTGLALANKVQLLGFRPPQKTTEQDGLVHIPYLILLNGSFLNVRNFVEGLENTKYKLAIEMVQFSSSDSSTDQVSATIGVIAYTLPNPPASVSGGSKATGTPAKSSKKMPTSESNAANLSAPSTLKKQEPANGTK